jgi:hypothetical protein
VRLFNLVALAAITKIDFVILTTGLIKAATIMRLCKFDVRKIFIIRKNILRLHRTLENDRQKPQRCHQC